MLENILHEKELRKCSKNFESTVFFIDSHRQNKVMVKPRDKHKKKNDNVLLIDNDPILRKELKLISREASMDVVDLRIHNNIDFVLKTKEMSNKIIPSRYYLKTNSTNVSVSQNEINNSEENYCSTEVFDIKCTQKTHEERKIHEESKYNCEKLVKDQISKPANNPIFTSDLKSDLQSLLIMMAISSSCNDKDKSNHTMHDHQDTQISNDVKTQITNTQTSVERYTACEISNLLKIEALKITTHNEISVLKKYAYKWMDYVKKQREKNSQCQRLENINKFLDRLEKRKLSVNINPESVDKARLQVRDYNTYQHRYKMQKHIIALQKAKLEQQNRIIEELKYNKIIEASQQSLGIMKEDIKQTYYDIDKHLKPKIKCLTNELKIREIEENSLILHCLKVPQFLQRMEARAREREEKHAIIRERRKQMEEERIRLKQQAEIAKTEMDKEEKLKRIKELREKRRREKIENIRKKQHAERLRALIVMADLHYEKSLTAKYGIRPLKFLIDMKRDNMEKAKAHYQFQLKKNVFLHWMWHTEDMWYDRNYKADDYSRKKLLRKVFNCFKKNHNEYLIKLQVAKDYYDLYVTQIAFRGFQKAVLILKEEFSKKWSTAIVYNNSNLLFKTVTCWRTLPALNALKREQEARKLRWREKVLQVVPDYVPPEE